MAEYNYAGYLIKIHKKNNSQTDYVIPESFIAYNSLDEELSTLDLDAYRDANGALHRKAIDVQLPKIEFTTPYINSKVLQDVLSEIRARYVNETEKKFRASVWCEEINDYVTQYFYLTSDVHFTIYKKITQMENVNGVMQQRTRFLYNPVRMAFIGYGTNSNNSSV